MLLYLQSSTEHIIIPKTVIFVAISDISVNNSFTFKIYFLNINQNVTKCIDCHISEISLLYLRIFFTKNGLFDDPMTLNFEYRQLVMVVAGSRMDHLGSPTYALVKFC
eukprot:113870_1